MSRLFAAAALALMLTVSINAQEKLLVDKYGESQRPRIQRGIAQVRQFWRAEDGTPAEMEAFIVQNFAGTPGTHDALFNRFQFALESVDGHMAEIARDLKWQADLDIGTVYPFDETMAGYDPSAHLNDDWFQNKLAFIVLLNFPLTTLEQRLTEGEQWSRRQWAEAKLALRFSRRVPSEVNLAYAKAYADASQYVATYNVWMH
ncbi:MAG TPA: hypothetical protein VF698_02740, partial [Thermoanaerobaculia bacterium]